MITYLVRIFEFEQISRDPERVTLWFCLVWYPATIESYSPEFLEILPSISSSENVDFSALKIGKTNSFSLSRIAPIPEKTIGVLGGVKIFLVVVLNGSNILDENTVLSEWGFENSD